MKEMTEKETHDPMPTTRVEEARRSPTTTTTTTTDRSVEVVITGFRGYHFLNLATFRKIGVPVVTTVLFAVANGKIYVWTTKDSGKVKRIRNNATVRIAPSTRQDRPLGPTVAASARILSDAEQTEAQTLTDREFGWLKKFFGLIWRLQGREEEVYLEITPTEKGGNR
jgi:uncharacterized protein